MKEVPFEEARKIQLDILVWFDKYCRENGLDYSLGEGTLIGAIRHKGFIPWDDDIDLLMPRKDYNKFLSQYKGGKYRLISLNTDKLWWSAYSRLTDESTIVCWESNPRRNYHGLWISLLPIDDYPKDDNWWQKNERKFEYFRKIVHIKDRVWNNNLNFFRNVFISIEKIGLSGVTYNSIGKKIDQIISSHIGEETGKKGHMACIWHKPWVFSADLMDEYIDLPFENYQFKVLKGYDAYLRCQYGDYMQLPPIEKQVAQHNYIAYYKD